MSSVEDGSNRPHNRPREDAPGVLPSSNFTASEDMWFEDGNIILVCESIGFRVYKGILSSQSEVFRDMFSIGNPSEDDTFNGCAIVHLSDSAHDFLYFLKTFHDRDYGPSLREVPRHDLPLGTIAGILRMSTKYSARGLRKEIVDDLKTMHPSTFYKFIGSQDDRDDTPDFNGILAVNIDIEYRIPSILPVAYYYCSLMSIQTLLEGFCMESGIVVKLSPSALLVALNFHEEMAREIVHLTRVSRDLELQGWKCPHSMCRLDPVLAALDVETHHLDWSEEGFFTSDYFSLQYSGVLCAACFPLLRRRECDLQLKIWGILPRMCGEESWVALEQKQQEIDRSDAIVW